MKNLIETTHITPGQKFYSVSMFNIEKYAVMVQHSRRQELKYVGGTYQDRESAKKRNEEGDYYDNFDMMSTRSRIMEILVEHTGLDISDRKVFIMSELIIKKFFSDKAKLAAVIEMMEEVAIIPIEMKLFHSQKRGIMQYFFETKKAMAFSKEKQEFIVIERIGDLPIEGVDYDTLDSDIECRRLIPVDELGDCEKHNFSNAHREVYHGLSMKLYAENRVSK